MADGSKLPGRRILLLGAETELGRAIASALAEAGARLALIGASNEAETAFAVQRLARRVGAEVSQAIDATNEMAVRVMVRQVSKALGGIEGAICATQAPEAFSLLQRFAGREFGRTGQRGVILAPANNDEPADVVAALAALRD